MKFRFKVYYSMNPSQIFGIGEIVDPLNHTVHIYENTNDGLKFIEEVEFNEDYLYSIYSVTKCGCWIREGHIQNDSTLNL